MICRAAGGGLVSQGADGYEATIKSGVINYRDGAHTGALLGGLVRDAQFAPA